MPLCLYSRDYDDKGFTLLDNSFVTEYLPVLSEDSIRVYIYGLFLCSNPLGEDNTVEGLCKGLSLSADALMSALEYLKGIGLITFASTNPLCVHFNSPKKAILPNRTYNKDKYSDFLIDLQQLFADRELSETEIIAYVDFLEETKMEQGALLLILKYCIDLKGTSIRKAYVLTVAKNWFNEGCKTLADTENRLLQAEAASAELREVMHALKSKRTPDIEDRQLYIKWTQTFGFTFDAIIAAAKQIKRGGIERLDSLLESYRTAGVYSAADIKQYGERKKQILDCTYKLIGILGLYYQDCTYISETYTAEWFRLGYTAWGLEKIASYCNINNIRDFAGLADTVQRFFAEGYVSDHSIKLQLDALTSLDDEINKIIYATGSTRKVTQSDRDLYRTWTERWGFGFEDILSLANQAQGKAYTMSWISSRLTELRTNGAAWKPAEEGSKAQTNKEELGAFEKAEIKAKLLEDSQYSAMQAEKRKLEFEMSGYAFSGKDVPTVMKEKQTELMQAIDNRIRALGYDPSLL